MKEKIPWTKQEDQTLLKCINNQNNIRWNVVAEDMSKILGKKSRNQKQIRERYINYLMVKSDEIQWNQEKQEQMIQLHREFGSRWVKISQQMPKTTQGFVKNKFYARLRSTVRRLNKFSRSKMKSSITMIKQRLIFSLAHIVERKSQESRKIPKSLSKIYSEFLYLLLQYTQKIFFMFISKSEYLKEYTLKLIHPFHTLELIQNKITQRKQKKNDVSKFKQLQKSQILTVNANRTIQNNDSQKKGLKLQVLKKKAQSQVYDILQFYQERVQKLFYDFKKENQGLENEKSRYIKKKQTINQNRQMSQCQQTRNCHTKIKLKVNQNIQNIYNPNYMIYQNNQLFQNQNIKSNQQINPQKEKKFFASPKIQQKCQKHPPQLKNQSQKRIFQQHRHQNHNNYEQQNIRVLPQNSLNILPQNEYFIMLNIYQQEQIYYNEQSNEFI